MSCKNRDDGLELTCAQCRETYPAGDEQPEDHAEDCPVRGDLEGGEE